MQSGVVWWWCVWGPLAIACPARGVFCHRRLSVRPSWPCSAIFLLPCSTRRWTEGCRGLRSPSCVGCRNADGTNELTATALLGLVACVGMRSGKLRTGSVGVTAAPPVSEGPQGNQVVQRGDFLGSPAGVMYVCAAVGGSVLGGRCGEGG